LKVLGSKILFALKKRCFTRVILGLLHIAILERLSRRLIVVEMTLQVEYVEAKSPKRLEIIENKMKNVRAEQKRTSYID
jgi:hypothetical protein